jgi:hypothetical protein
MMQNPLSTLETREDRSGITGFFARLGDAVGRTVMHSLSVEPTVVALLRAIAASGTKLQTTFGRALTIRATLTKPVTQWYLAVPQRTGGLGPKPSVVFRIYGSTVRTETS